MAADVIEVYGHDLVEDVIGRWTFAELTFAALTNGRRPTAAEATMVDALLTTFVDHGVTPSSLATRLTFLGAPEAMQAAIAAGLCGAGSHYLGTMQTAAEMLTTTVNANSSPSGAAAAAAIVARYRSERRQIPGLGHPEHKTGDPRTPKLSEIARHNGCFGAHCHLLFAVADAFFEATGKMLPVNAAGLSGAIVSDMGLPPHAGRGLAIISRAAGLVGVVLSEMRTPTAQGIWDELRTPTS